METITTDELNKILKAHIAWLSSGGEEGKPGQQFYPNPDTTVIIERVCEQTIEASIVQFTPSGFIWDDRLVSFPIH